MIDKTNLFEINHSSIIDDVIVYRTSKNRDERGSLYTTFKKNIFESYLPDGLTFNHDKFSTSYKNVLRGIHGDTKSWKLVTCVYGSIFQVVVDCRKDSSTYLKWDSFYINDDNQISVLLPPGLGNAFCVLSDKAVYHYKLAYVGDYVDAQEQFSIKWNDVNIGISWPIINPILSNRDK